MYIWLFSYKRQMYKEDFLTMDSYQLEVAYAREVHMQLNWKCKKDECMIVGIHAVVMVAGFLSSKGRAFISKIYPRRPYIKCK